MDFPSILHWNEEKNQRRCQLIDNDVEGKITKEESKELENLQDEMLKYRQKVAPLPLEEIREVYQELKESVSITKGITVIKGPDIYNLGINAYDFYQLVPNYQRCEWIIYAYRYFKPEKEEHPGANTLGKFLLNNIPIIKGLALCKENNNNGFYIYTNATYAKMHVEEIGNLENILSDFPIIYKKFQELNKKT